MSPRIRLEPRAIAEIEAARDWWIKNRPAARAAFDEELEWAFGMFRTFPGAGQLIEVPGQRELRRLFLGRIRYHLYYRFVGDTVDVVALWHASRGTGPDL